MSGFRLIFRNPHLDHPLHHADRVRGDVHNGRHLHDLSGADIELCTVPRADDVKAFEITLPNRAIIVRADIADGKELSRDVEDDESFVTHVHEETLAAWEFRGGGDIYKVEFGFVEGGVVKHSVIWVF